MAVETGPGVRGVGMDEGDGDQVGAVVVAGAGLGAADERADPDGDVPVAARRPGLQILAGVEQCSEGVEGGLVLGGEGAGGVAAAAEEAALHRVGSTPARGWWWGW